MIKQYNASNFPDFSDRDEKQDQDVDGVVADIIARVRREGDAALYAYSRQFDGAALDGLEVGPQELETAFNSVDKAFLSILERSAANITAFHTRQKRQGFVIDDAPGVVMGQKVTALDRVGVYVPGGTASYPSTVLMDVLPARIAGVGEIIMATPAKNGVIPAEILAAARVAGVDRIFKIGGAQAIAALSYGTESVPRVDKIVGPGNVYVATAKRMVYGRVDIDMIAGPSEILVLADGTANPAHVAADLLSQAEHDVLASAVLVTTSQALADRVAQELEAQLNALPRERIARPSIENYGAIVVVDTLEQGIDVANRIAPEHMEVCVDEPFALLPLIRHAGSIFLGKNVPEALGDYFAGPNHTLPTNGTARFSSPLSVDDFTKKSSFIYYDKGALSRVAGDVAAFARREGLDGHARSVEIRMEGKA